MNILGIIFHESHCQSHMIHVISSKSNILLKSQSTTTCASLKNNDRFGITIGFPLSNKKCVKIDTMDDKQGLKSHQPYPFLLKNAKVGESNFKLFT